MTKNWNEEQYRSAQNIFDYISKNPHTNSERITIDKMLEGADLNLWDDGKAEGLEKGLEGQREIMQKLFIQCSIT